MFEGGFRGLTVLYKKSLTSRTTQTCTQTTNMLFLTDISNYKDMRTFEVRDRREKGWFYIDNEYLNGFAKHFGAIGTAIYVSLCRHADGEQKCYPSQKLIA